MNADIEDVGPSDSISNACNSHLKHNSVCGKSNVSSTSSAHLTARAEHGVCSFERAPCTG